MADVENLPKCQDEVDGPNAGPAEIYEPALDEANKFVKAMESSSKIEDKCKEEYSLPQDGVELVSSASDDREYVEEITESRSSEVITSVEETNESRSSCEDNKSVEEINGGISCKVNNALEEETIENKSCVTNSEPSVSDNDVDSNFSPVLHEMDDSSNKAKLNMQVVEETNNESVNKSCDDDSVEETNNGSQSCDVTLVKETSESKSVNNESVTETPVNSVCDTSVLSTPTPSNVTPLSNTDNIDPGATPTPSYITPLSNTDNIDPGATPTPSYVTPLSNTDNIDPGALSRVSVSFDFERPRDQVITVTLPDTKHCPAYALVLCAWSNILGPHAQYVWQTEGKHNFTPDMMSYLSTHTLTSSDQPQNTVDTKMLILKDRGIIVTSFLFSGYDGDEKTVFSLSLVVPYIDRHWYLPLHEFCVSRLNMMIGRLRVLQDKYKEERGDRAIEKFAEDVPKFIGVLTLLKTSSPGSKIQLQNTVFAVDRALDVQFTRM